MIDAAFAALPPPDANCRCTVVIPAKNEAATIERTLAALADQRFADPRHVDVIVYANDCSDDTAARVDNAQRRTPQLRILVATGALPRDAAHIGRARRAVMDAAAERFFAAGRPGGIIASTDADSIVDRLWIAQTIAAMHDVDAVTGRIEVIPAEWDALPPHMRNNLALHTSYVRALATLEAVLDPLDHDPAPRHSDHFGASFAVTARAYRAAGGCPELPQLEDLALYRALLRSGARVRHSNAVHVATSARTLARVEGGFATHLRALDHRGPSWFVENPRDSIETLSMHARMRAGMTSAEFSDFCARFDERPRRYPTVPVEVAVATVRATIAASNAPRPTRISAASGAG